MHSGDTRFLGSFPDDLPPEVNVLLGVYLLYWKIDEVIDAINVTPVLSKNERHLIVNLSAPCGMGELAAEMQILPSTLTALANGLEEKGLLMREQDPADRRVWRLRLTEAGRAKREALMTRAADLFADISGLTPNETRTISGLMLKIARNIKANGLPEGARPCS